MTEHNFAADRWCLIHEKYCGMIDASTWLTDPQLPAYLLPTGETVTFEVYEVEQETCDYCDQPINEDNPGEPCSGADGPVHSQCHYESGCTRVE